MQVFDIHNGSKAEIALANQAITTDTTTNGVIIDTFGFQALEFLFQVATVTDGVYVVKMEEGNDPGLSDAADVSTEETLGNADFTTSDSNSSKRFGYIGKKQFARIVITSTGVTTGVDAISSLALLANAHHQPTLGQ